MYVWDCLRPNIHLFPVVSSAIQLNWTIEQLKLDPCLSIAAWTQFLNHPDGVGLSRFLYSHGDKPPDRDIYCNFSRSNRGANGHWLILAPPKSSNIRIFGFQTAGPRDHRWPTRDFPTHRKIKHVQADEEEEADADPESRLVNCCAAAARLYLMQKNQI